MSLPGAGPRVTSDDLLTASDWEARLEDARARREAVLANRKGPKPAPTKPWTAEDKLPQPGTDGLIDESSHDEIAKFKEEEQGISRFTAKRDIPNLTSDDTSAGGPGEGLSVASFEAGERRRTASGKDLLPELEPADQRSGVVSARARVRRLGIGSETGLDVLSSSLSFAAIAAALMLIPREIGDAALPFELELLSAPPYVTVPLVSALAAEGPKSAGFGQIADIGLADIKMPRWDFSPFVGPSGFFPPEVARDAVAPVLNPHVSVDAQVDVAMLSGAFETASSLSVSPFPENPDQLRSVAAPLDPIMEFDTGIDVPLLSVDVAAMSDIDGAMAPLINTPYADVRPAIMVETQPDLDREAPAIDVPDPREIRLFIVTSEVYPKRLRGHWDYTD